MREHEARHPQDAVDVRVQDSLLVVLVRLPERVATEREARVVEEDVHRAERGGRLLDERGAARHIADVERQSDVGVEAFDASRARRYANSRVAKLANSRGSDAARG